MVLRGRQKPVPHCHSRALRDVVKSWPLHWHEVPIRSIPVRFNQIVSRGMSKPRGRCLDLTLEVAAQGVGENLRSVSRIPCRTTPWCRGSLRPPPARRAASPDRVPRTAVSHLKSDNLRDGGTLTPNLYPILYQIDEASFFSPCVSLSPTSFCS